MAVYLFPAVMSRGIISQTTRASAVTAASIWNSVATSGALTINVVAAAKTYTRTTGSFITDGFQVDDQVTMGGFTNAGNNGVKIVKALSDTVMTVTSLTTLVDESGNNNETVAGSRKPAAGVKGFIALAKAANAASVFVGSSAVTTANGIPMVASDYAAGAVDGPGATEIYFIAADALQNLLVVEIG